MKRNLILLLVVLFLSPAVIRGGEDDWMKKAGTKEPPGSIRTPASSARSAEAPKAPSNIDPFAGVVDVQDFYKVGEVCIAMDWSSYFSAIYPQLKERIAEHRELLKKAKVSDATIALFDQAAAMIVTLPFDKNYDQWPQESKDKWLNDPNWKNFIAAIKKEMIDNVYYWLGHHAMELTWSLPRMMSGNTLNANAISKLRGAALDYAWIQSQAGFSTFTPEVQAAVKTIAALNSKSNPDDPFSKAFDIKDWDQMKQAAASIRQAAQAGKLVS